MLKCGRSELDNTMRRGFTLVEIMIVVMIIGMLAMIAVPGWMKLRQTSREKACEENRQKIEDAKQLWAGDEGKTAADTPTMNDLVPSYLTTEPKCPESGTYTIGNATEEVTCSVHGS